MQIILLPADSQVALSSLAQTSRIISSSSSTNGSEFDYDLSGEDNCQVEKPARKRQRLDHMTEQEKQYRRKLKNRVAAQTARDKKKAKMDELEIIVEQLRLENNLLRAENERLLVENARLAANTKVTGEARIVVDGDAISNFVEAMYPVESAALINGPLPQGQGYIQLSTILKMFLHLMMLILQSPATQPNALKVAAFNSQNPSEKFGKRLQLLLTQPVVIQFLKKHPP